MSRIQRLYKKKLSAPNRQAYRPINPETGMPNKYWISPTGETLDTSWDSHLNAMSEYLKSKGIMSQDPIRWALNNGWARVNSNGLEISKPLTEAQVGVLNRIDRLQDTIIDITDESNLGSGGWRTVNTPIHSIETVMGANPARINDAIQQYFDSGTKIDKVSAVNIIDDIDPVTNDKSTSFPSTYPAGESLHEPSSYHTLETQRTNDPTNLIEHHTAVDGEEEKDACQGPSSLDELGNPGRSPHFDTITGPAINNSNYSENLSEDPDLKLGEVEADVEAPYSSPCSGPISGHDDDDKLMNIQRGSSLSKEATVGNIVRILGIPRDVAEAIHAVAPRADMAMAKIYKSWLTYAYVDVEAIREATLDPINFNSFLADQQNHETGADEQDRLFFCLGLPKFVSAINTSDLDYTTVLKFIDETISENAVSKLTIDNAVLTFPDGFYWVPISDYELDLEGIRMQHCGLGSNVYSLRDSNNKPHVTIDFKNQTLTQCKGKQNVEPDKKYWSYIKGVIDQFGINTVVAKIDAMDGLWSWLGLVPVDDSGIPWDEREEDEGGGIQEDIHPPDYRDPEDRLASVKISGHDDDDKLMNIQRGSSLSKEATVGNIVRILGIPKEVAEAIHDKYPKFDFAAAVIIKCSANSLQKIIKDIEARGETYWSAQNEQDFWYDAWHRSNIDVDDGEVVKILSKYPNIVKYINSNWSVYINMDNGIGALSNKIDDLNADEMGNDLAKGGPNISANSIITFPDGFYWVPVETSEDQAIEGVMMQHCGVPAASMYSLRDSNNKPHVTIDVENSILVQCKGKQNSDPDQKYWPYIKSFTDKFGINGYYNDAAILYDLVAFLQLSSLDRDGVPDDEFDVGEEENDGVPPDYRDPEDRLASVKMSDLDTDVYVSKIDTRDGIDIWMVDGLKVRNDLEPDFVMGGNSGRFEFIPENEIWIDNSVSAEELDYTVQHELCERKLMLGDGEDYETAHDDALDVERELRMDDQSEADQHNLDPNEKEAVGIPDDALDENKYSEPDLRMDLAIPRTDPAGGDNFNSP
jgi:hypothetical protein